MIGRLVSAALAVLMMGLLASAHADPQDAVRLSRSWPRIATPTVPAGPVELRVGHVVNPRFPRFTDAQIALYLGETARVAKAHLGLELRFAAVETVDIATVFARFDPALSRYLDGFRYDVRADTGDRQAVRRAVTGETAFAVKLNGFDGIYDYAAPYLVKPAATRDVPGLAAAAVDTLFARLGALRDAPALDGRATIDAQPYHEFMYWDSIGYAPLPWEVVITNQPVVSVEYFGYPIHAALRGGITAGSTNYSHDGSFRTVSWLSTFAFTSDVPAVVALRGGERYDAETAARLAGAYHVHELGHQLLGFTHPFGNPACVMTPAELLKFRQWYDGLDPARCAIGSSKAMTVGAIRLWYDPQREPGAAR
jgi:hypothetical protein